MFEPLVAWMAPRYQAVVVKELKKYGLRYEDLYDPELDLVRASGGGAGGSRGAGAWREERGRPIPDGVVAGGPEPARRLGAARRVPAPGDSGSLGGRHAPCRSPTAG